MFVLENEVNVWDAGEDSVETIRIDPKKGVVAATFNKLVEKLTSERDHGKWTRQEEWISGRVGQGRGGRVDRGGSGKGKRGGSVGGEEGKGGGSVRWEERREEGIY